jgi:hypothetical protein
MLDACDVSLECGVSAEHSPSAGTAESWLACREIGFPGGPHPCELMARIYPWLATAIQG